VIGDKGSREVKRASNAGFVPTLVGKKIEPKFIETRHSLEIQSSGMDPVLPIESTKNISSQCTMIDNRISQIFTKEFNTNQKVG
jgi:hypothetical protein